MATSWSLTHAHRCIFMFIPISSSKGYIKDFQVYDQHKVGKITVELQGRINDCQALTYRQYHKAKDIEKYTSNKLLTIRSVLIPCTFVVLKLFVIDP
ncbi:hypothetical protein VitviT2T_016000 [Vitis vinifera]|uniref:Uncharacterized protein n=1 Tax=Vitis vinifera TaxID=29760 RepID=A0ABY9CPK6_VITVI|nr:hypothetical protein VitviT2T_016000 [Vitis vinifera]